MEKVAKILLSVFLLGVLCLVWIDIKEMFVAYIPFVVCGLIGAHLMDKVENKKRVVAE